MQPSVNHPTTAPPTPTDATTGAPRLRTVTGDRFPRARAARTAVAAMGAGPQVSSDLLGPARAATRASRLCTT